MQARLPVHNNDEMICSDCGFRAERGGLTCEALRDRLLARDFEEPALYWASHRMAVDAYCCQHAAYVASAKSLAAHLCGLCIAFERQGDPHQLRQLQNWLTTNPKIDKPALPVGRGDITIGHVCGIEDPADFRNAVRSWALAVWDAYKDLQPTARAWLAMGLAHGASRSHISSFKARRTPNL